MSIHPGRRFDGKTPFALWIRTGRWVPAQLADPTLEVKFNPNHDPKDGRFASGPGGGRAERGRQPKTRRPPDRGDGSWGGGGFTGGGGGSGGGAGASGDGYWMNPEEVRAFRRAHPGLDPHMASPGETLDQIAVDHHTTTARLRQLNGLASDVAVKPGQILALPKNGSAQSTGLRHIAKNGYDFAVDSADRTREAKGELHRADRPERSKTSQKRAGGADRRVSDDGGHFIAARFGGPRDWFNHFAQDANFNRGGYRVIESGWAKDLRAGKHVSVDIEAHYPGQSQRPDSLTVRWSTNGQSYKHVFRNEPKGKSHG